MRPDHPPSRETLLTAALGLCTDFSNGCSPEVLLAHFTHAVPPVAIEHGLQSLAPFIGRQFFGRAEITEYFKLLQKYVTFDKMCFCEYIVDTDTMKVSCKGHASFTWKETGQGWDEVFTYTLDFVHEGGDGEIKVRRYQVWADTGAAWLASKGELKGKSGEEAGEEGCKKC
ncbi:hypothetical protein BZA05DRAFT_406480 [Tricharina praecox]|uniref:uncharacterized protein n=1 Tax=Tricharina praecox TaxID=43433 RepID=UPI0022203C3C|nr:uncharacterized protein BZA05DRAFT_406480 [Tricharina praecox]KAI5846742.1 hypothetical protein BZA05DRAFT_406480 [Tricharina praecox]